MVTFTPGITVCVPTIPPRAAMYERALASIVTAAKSMPSGVPVQVAATVDVDKLGAAATRQGCLELVTTEWVAFVDDDDTIDPCHLRELYLAAREHNADYLWSRFRIGLPFGQTRPGPSPLGPGSFDQWSDEQPAQTTITTLVRTELALDAGGFTPPPTDHEIDGQRAGEDWLFTLACRDVGGVFRHVPKVTWTWNHHASNTSGLPDRW